MKKNIAILSLSLIVLYLAGCTGQTREAPVAQPTQAPPTRPVSTLRQQPNPSVLVWPLPDWPTSSPEQQGMDPDRINQMLDSIQAREINLHSLLVVRHGSIVFETYFPPYKQESLHELYSVTKSFLSTLVGIAADQGSIPDLDRKAISYFPGMDFAHLDSRKRSMTVKHLLTMTSGLDWQEGDPAYRAMYTSPNWVQYVLDLPMAEDPGRRFEYCSGCSHLLSAILQEATGENPRDFAVQNLFAPLGITDFRWETGSQGIPIGGWGLNLTSRDMAKLGYLFLHQGNWNGKQVVSKEWVQASVTRQAVTGGELDYGYQWWIYPSHGAYAALGLAGQTILVVPELDMVIVTTAEMDGHEAIFDLAEEYIFPAVEPE